MEHVSQAAEKKEVEAILQHNTADLDRFFRVNKKVNIGNLRLKMPELEEGCSSVNGLEVLNATLRQKAA